MKLSVFIIVQDEEKNIERCLRSVAWADEIVVVDGGSTDSTPKICRRYTPFVHHRPFDDYASQKNYALSKTTGEWAFSLDADEEVTPELKQEILSVLSGASAAAYSVGRRSRMFGRWMRFSGTQHDRPTRLLRKGLARFEQPVHERVVVEGRIGKLRSPLLHYTYNNAADYLVRMNRYTSLEARQLGASGASLRTCDLLIKPWLLFFKLYLWDQGFRDGLAGFVFCFFSGTYVFLKHAKHRESVGALR